MRAVIILLATLLLFCGGNDPPPGPQEQAFLFAMRGVPGAEGRFVAVTSDPELLARVRAQLALPEAERNLHINGPVAPGNGGHNLGWSWHFTPDRWDLVEISIELCDGRPQHVEDDVETWIADVGNFCPWSSYVAGEI